MLSASSSLHDLKRTTLVRAVARQGALPLSFAKQNSAREMIEDL